MKRKIKQTPFHRADTSHDWIGFWIVFLFFGILFAKSFTSPINGWDGWAIWGLKAKAIFAVHSLEGLGFCHSNPSYPPLLPVAMSELAVGGEGWINLLFPLFALCLYSIIRDEISKVNPPQFFVNTLPLMIYTSPVFASHTLRAYANLLMCVYVLKVLSLSSKLSNENSPRVWFSWGGFLSGLVLLRPEGVVYAIYFILWVVGKGCLKKVQLHKVLSLAMPVFCVVLWSFYSKSIPVFSGTYGGTGIPDWSHFKIILYHIAKFSFDPKLWGAIVIAFIFLVVTRWRSAMAANGSEFFLLLMGLGGLVGYSYYWCLPRATPEFFFKYGYPRFFMPFVPIMFVILLKEFIVFLSEKASLNDPKTL